MRVTTDIDIDVADRDRALAGLRHTAACRIGADGTRERHASGVYFQAIPADPLDRLAAFDFRTAPELGFFKLDVLNNTIYQGIRDEAHLLELMHRPPPWELFDDPVIIGALAHIHGHADVVRTIRPRSVADLAVCLALIRPGKRHLMGRPRAEIDAAIWQPEPGYVFKRAHAIAYALAIVVQLNHLIDTAPADQANDGAAAAG